MMAKEQLYSAFFILTFLSLFNLYLLYRGVPEDIGAADCSSCTASEKSSFSASRRFSLLPERSKVNGVILILARNSDAGGLVQSISMVEEKFNRKFNYPYVFLNEEKFDNDFKASMNKLSNSTMFFGLIPKEHWSYPRWVDQKRADNERSRMERDGIVYGGSLSYRHMCRFNSGFFFHHELLKSYDYYWRVEPDVKFFCDTDYDPFLYMKKSKKEYGFNLMLPEFESTIPTLWNATMGFINRNPDMVHPESTLRMFKSAEGNYNLCHFWSNFEIGSLKFFRSKVYGKYFEHLDRTGGFFYERWGDAPVHSLAVGMFLPKEKIHYFEDIGYFHSPHMNCPQNPSLQLHCSCDGDRSEMLNNNCFNRYLGLYSANV